MGVVEQMPTQQAQTPKPAGGPASFDVAVIGAGPGGYVAAIRCGQLGLKAVVIDEGRLGGVCLNVGCIPSKAIISAAKDFKHAASGADKGLTFADPLVDMGKLVRWKQSVVDKLTGGVATLLKANKVEMMSGRATLTGPGTLEVVSGRDKRTVNAKHVIVATGSSTIEIPGFKFDEKRILSSTGALDLTEVPRHLVIIGGGVIGLELGCAYANLGSKVTVVEMMDQLVPGVDLDIAKGLERILKRRGFAIHLKARAKEAKVGPAGVKVTFDANGDEQVVDCDYVLVSVGRRPNTKNLGLEKAGVKLDERGFVPTDLQKRSNVATVFAIGDITHGPMLAHKASKEGIVAAEAIAASLKGTKTGAGADWVTIPGVIFTDPEIATAGMTEAQAKAAGHAVKVGTFQVGGLGRALAASETDGFYKVIADAKTDALLGVHILGPGASDLISEAVLALEMGATAEDLALTVHPHPTLSEGLMEAAEALHGKAIHAVNRPAA
ncbi:MAG: dihydrolipoamide dehydrogenase [Thermoplasmata archaeon]|jgi:dihydrolipoamide dehydrogenase|nr:dihydrolipoamide dehydrogenase [Thermoplasmata archaeon]MEA3165834.1 dihydrolipoamide dehydrogenase [Thermoplasmata archaeon]